MKAILFDQFGGEIRIDHVPEPKNSSGSVIIKVMATGLCRSDWHGWMGHDPDIKLPHVPGHELAGIVAETGSGIKNWHIGDRVTLPFVCGCGECPECRSDNQQVCDNQFQPGFTDWGSFAQYVRIDYADQNLVRIPDSITFEMAASLGCRFITSYRALVHQGRVGAGNWVAVHGCGGVGLSAILIAKALDAKVIAIDISDDKLTLANDLGADFSINAAREEVVERIHSISSRGAHVSVDALGSSQTCINSILGLRKRGRHVQIGLMANIDATPPIPMGPVIANELEIIGSHGMQAHAYPKMFDLILRKHIDLNKLIGRTISLEEGAIELANLNSFKNSGITIINPG